MLTAGGSIIILNLLGISKNQIKIIFCDNFCNYIHNDFSQPLTVVIRNDLCNNTSKKLSTITVFFTTSNFFSNKLTKKRQRHLKPLTATSLSYVRHDRPRYANVQSCTTVLLTACFLQSESLFQFICAVNFCHITKQDPNAGNSNVAECQSQ